MTKAKLKQSIFDCLEVCKNIFQDYSLRRNYNDYWRSKILNDFRMLQSYLKHFTKNRQFIFIRSIKNLEKLESEFYNLNYELFTDLEGYLNIYSEIEIQELKRKRRLNYEI